MAPFTPRKVAPHKSKSDSANMVNDLINALLSNCDLSDQDLKQMEEVISDAVRPDVDQTQFVGTF